MGRRGNPSPLQKYGGRQPAPYNTFIRRTVGDAGPYNMDFHAAAIFPLLYPGKENIFLFFIVLSANFCYNGKNIGFWR